MESPARPPLDLLGFLVLLGTERWFEWIPITPIPVLVACVAVALLWRGRAWASLGFRRTPIPWQVGALGLGVVLQAWSLRFLEPAIARWIGSAPDVSVFAPIAGDAVLLMGALVFSWIFAAFGEEIVFRGYLLQRLIDTIGRRRFGALVGLLLSSALFGVMHTYQGPAGVLATGVIGLLLGTVYLATGRNLWVVILAHGSYDTYAFTLLYLGLYPGLT